MEPDKSQLELLIKYFEAEKRNLKRMIKDAAAEMDNLLVYYHSEALLDIESRLRVLYSFRDPDYVKKEDLKRKINFLTTNKFIKRMSPAFREFNIKRNKEEVETLKKRLYQLNQAKVVQDLTSSTKIEHALFLLYDEKYRAFKISLGEDLGYIMELIFRIRENILIIELNGQIGDTDPDFVFEDRIPQPLKAAGFEYDPLSEKYIRTLDISGLANLKEIKMWLAKLIIEDSWFYSPGGTMRLEYEI